MFLDHENADWELLIDQVRFRRGASTLPPKESVRALELSVSVSGHSHVPSSPKPPQAVHLLMPAVSLTPVATNGPGSRVPQLPYILRPLVPSTSLCISISLLRLVSEFTHVSLWNDPLTFFLEQLELKSISPSRACLLPAVLNGGPFLSQRHDHISGLKGFVCPHTASPIKHEKEFAAQTGNLCKKMAPSLETHRS